jgi:hypothetical protein
MKERKSQFSRSTTPETESGSRMCTGRFGILLEGRRKGMVSRRGAEAQGRRSVDVVAVGKIRGWLSAGAAGVNDAVAGGEGSLPETGILASALVGNGPVRALERPRQEG